MLVHITSIETPTDVGMPFDSDAIAYFGNESAPLFTSHK